MWSSSNSSETVEIEEMRLILLSNFGWWKHRHIRYCTKLRFISYAFQQPPQWPNVFSHRLDYVLLFYDVVCQMKIWNLKLWCAWYEIMLSEVEEIKWQMSQRVFIVVLAFSLHLQRISQNLHYWKLSLQYCPDFGFTILLLYCKLHEFTILYCYCIANLKVELETSRPWAL